MFGWLQRNLITKVEVEGDGRTCYKTDPASFKITIKYLYLPEETKYVSASTIEKKYYQYLDTNTKKHFSPDCNIIRLNSETPKRII